MRVLLYVPVSRSIDRVWDGILEQQVTDDIHITVQFDPTGNDPALHRYANCTNKCEGARLTALERGFDALFLVDDDMLLPEDALHKLAATGADIAYGLYAWRNAPHHHNAVWEIREPGHIVPMNMRPERCAAAWGQVVDVAGVGSGCTLIKREVLAAVRFERRGPHCFDYYLACDAQRLGFTQKCDTSVLVGHVDGERVYWPTVEGYRVEDGVYEPH